MPSRSLNALGADEKTAKAPAMFRPWWMGTTSNDRAGLALSLRSGASLAASRASTSRRNPSSSAVASVAARHTKSCSVKNHTAAPVAGVNCNARHTTRPSAASRCTVSVSIACWASTSADSGPSSKSLTNARGICFLSCCTSDSAERTCSKDAASRVNRWIMLAESWA